MSDPFGYNLLTILGKRGPPAHTLDGQKAKLCPGVRIMGMSSLVERMPGSQQGLQITLEAYVLGRVVQWQVQCWSCKHLPA